MATAAKVETVEQARTIAVEPQGDALAAPAARKRGRKAQTLAASPAPVQPSNSLLGPVTSVADAKERWAEYQQLCREILDPDTDYVYFACALKPDGWPVKPMGFRTRAAAEIQLGLWGKMRFTDLYVKESKKRSAWDKLARFYGIDTPLESDALCTTAEAVEVGEYIIEKLQGDAFKIFIYQDAVTLTVVKVTVLLRVVAQNGRTILGDGACSVSERSKGAESFAHPDHDILSTAFTRAFNRGVSRCIGTGEVSAEEFESADAGGNAATGPTVDSSTATAKASAGNLSVSQHQENQKAPDADMPQRKEGATERSPNAESKTATPSASAPVAAGPGPERATIPTMEEIAAQPSKQGTLIAPQASSDAAAAQTAKPEAQAVPTNGGAEAQSQATPPQSFSERFFAVKRAVFGDEKSNDRTLEYLFFALPPAATAVDIEVKGKWNPGKWNEAMAGKKLADNTRQGGLADRADRLSVIEQVLRDDGRENFLKWARALVETAKRKKIFVSK